MRKLMFGREIRDVVIYGQVQIYLGQCSINNRIR
jgi:hypothetical protein